MQVDRLKLAADGISEVSGDHAAFDDESDGVPEEDELDQGGFSGTCQTTLVDWIQLVQMGRRDAVVTIRTHDGKQGTLWCREGDIVDAACDGVFGEEAVFLALSWKGGHVTVDFEPVDVPREIEAATTGLMLKAAYRGDSGFYDIRHLAIQPDSVTLPGTPIAEISTAMVRAVKLFEVPSKMPSERRSESFVAPFEPFVAAPQPSESPRPISFRFLIAGGLSVLVLFSGLYLKLVYSGRSSAGATAAKPIPKLALGTWDPPRRLTQPPVEKARADAPATAPSVRRSVPPPSGAVNGATARRRGAMVAGKRSGASSPGAGSPSLPEAARTPAPAKARVEIIKERQPRIQIIPGPGPQLRGPGQPRIQVIDERNPYVQPVE